MKQSHEDLHEADKTSLDPQQYVLWTPGPGVTLETGADRHPIELPSIPLPLHRRDAADSPSSDAIGSGLYDYLRQFPDCPLNSRYAGLLRDAFPHYIADLGAQIVMLDHKEVDVAYVRRKLASLKIIGLLDPKNPGLLQQIGKTHLELGLIFAELKHSREHLLAAMGALQDSLRFQPDNPSVLNQLAQIDFLFGDYPSAIRRLRNVADLLQEGPVRQAVCERLFALEKAKTPDHPLVDDFEAVGTAVDFYSGGDFLNALSILERLDEQGNISRDFPFAEFYYLLGLCRRKNCDLAGAYAAFESALEVDHEYGPALEARDQIVDGGKS